MKPIRLFFVFLLIYFSVFAQNTSNDAASIRAQMSAIRKSTNWSDPAAAKSANAKIQELATKLTQALRQSNPTQQSQSGSSDTPADAETKKEIQQEMDDYNNKLWNQMMNIVREGDERKMDLAKPLRDEIVQEYKADEDPTVKNQEWLNEMTLLYIDMSSPTVQLVIDQMENYKSIQTLVITGGKNGAAVNLENLITKAAHYPLQQLYIINFMGFVTKIPIAISKFQNLSILALYNNNISKLPSEFSSLPKLKKLYVDINPIVSLTSALNKSNQLDTLGVAKTLIPEEEIARVKQQFPNCKILLK